MPELPEVETMVRGIRTEITGRCIMDVELCHCTRRPIQISPAPAKFRRLQKERVVRRVSRLAKRIVIELDGDDFVVIEPRMTGLMLVSDPPTVDHRRVCWHLKPKRGRVSSFEFWDRRGLGTVRLLNAAAMLELRQKLGPDALAMTAADWKKQLSRTVRPIKVAMLEQKLVAGIGNLYASEILHKAGVSPKRSAARVTGPMWDRIADATHHILNEAIRYEGSTLSDGTYRNALNKDGGYQNEHLVYQKADQPCPTCGVGKIQRIVQTQRATFYCSKCQR